MRSNADVSYGGDRGRGLRLMASARATTSSRLSVDDRIRAGFAILAVAFDYATSRDLSAALTLGMTVPRTAMV